MFLHASPTHLFVQTMADGGTSLKTIIYFEIQFGNTVRPIYFSLFLPQE